MDLKVDKLLTPKEVAERLKVSKSLVYAWIAEKRLKCRRFGQAGRRGAIRVAEGDLAAFVATCDGGPD